MYAQNANVYENVTLYSLATSVLKYWAILPPRHPSHRYKNSGNIQPYFESRETRLFEGSITLASHLYIECVNNYILKSLQYKDTVRGLESLKQANYSR